MTSPEYAKKYALAPDDFVYSPYAIDYSYGVTKCEDGTCKPNKIGCFVLTTKACDKIMKMRGEENV